MENKWEVILEFNGNEWEMNFEMKMNMLMENIMGSEFGKRFDYNE